MFVPDMEVTSRLLCAISSKEPLCIVLDAFFARKGRSQARKMLSHRGALLSKEEFALLLIRKS